VLLAPDGGRSGACQALAAWAPAEGRHNSGSILGNMLGDDGRWKLGSEPAGPRVLLLIGCPSDLPNFLSTLDLYLARGSVVHVLSQRSPEDREEAMHRHLLTLRSNRRTGVDGGPFDRISVVHHCGPTTEKRSLAELPLLTANCALVLSEYLSEDEVPSAVDTRSLTALILLRGLLRDCGRDVPGKKSAGRKRCKVVAELLDPKSRRVVEVNDNVRKLASFVYSAALETGVFTMAVQDKATYSLLMQLLSPGTTMEHIVAVPVGSFVHGEEFLSFCDLYATVWQACGGILLGWQREGFRYPELNPERKAKGLTWRADSEDILLILRPHNIVPPLQKEEVTRIMHLSAGIPMPPNCIPPQSA